LTTDPTDTAASDEASATPAPLSAPTTDAPSDRERTAPEGAGGFTPLPVKKPLGYALLGLGTLATFLLMSVDRALPHGPLWSFLGVLVAGAGVLELCGLLRAGEGDPRLGALLLAAKPDEPALFAPKRTLPLAFAVLLLGLVAFPVDDFALPIGAALLVLGLSALRRPALFVFVASSLLLLPMLGSYGLWDPWETHYGEVAREILARNDWITLWWAQDEWFRSKPVLIFWIEALSWGALGLPFDPDTNAAHPEWAIRLPHYVLTMAALLACYAAIARTFRPRAAVLACLVLVTTPYFFFLASPTCRSCPP